MGFRYSGEYMMGWGNEGPGRSLKASVLHWVRHLHVWSWSGCFFLSNAEVRKVLARSYVLPLPELVVFMASKGCHKVAKPTRRSGALLLAALARGCCELSRSLLPHCCRGVWGEDELLFL